VAQPFLPALNEARFLRPACFTGAEGAVLLDGRQESHLDRKDSAMQKITPFLWFDGNAEEAANFYISIFKNSKMGKISRYGDAGPGPKGSAMSVTFQIEGQEFFALNGGPQFKFTPAISFFVNCETQQEVDDLWAKLSAGGRTDRCGWLQDKFGLSWQIIPTVLGQLLGDKDPQRAKRAMQAMLQMTKIDIEKLQQAAAEPKSSVTTGD
jgi:predicted 3-demethylubiquinone-9 3-methyltransferase (glyoxalase superfamily)